MVGNGDHGQPWLAMVTKDRPWLDMVTQKNGPWSAMVTRQTMVGHGHRCFYKGRILCAQEVEMGKLNEDTWFMLYLEM
ncbi:hypothetical protein DPMN_048932 [Dreissena polymorpha]|uniref:Uncharacterized protein n=1 Tax=Dreissena polymorpha TaxID=45954 RepID=A0A9D4I0N1_DREPO|nr:hypothetical protein DPMN_048932 [Dreissena polymorpha]